MSNYCKNMINKNVGNDHLTLLHTTAASIDINKLKELINKKDSYLPYYIELKNYLEKIKINSKMKYLYIEAAQNSTGNTIYIADSIHSSNPYSGKLGDPINIDTKQSLAALKGIEGYSSIHTSYAWGPLLSAYTPLKDTSGNVIAILACDYPVNTVNTPFYKFLIFIIGIIFVISLIDFIIIKMLISKFLNPLKDISNGVKKITTNTFIYNVNVTSKDELEDLNKIIHNMTEYINKLLIEKNQYAEELNKMNLEIMGQKDEITVLYQETTTMNDNLYELLDEIKVNYLSTVRCLAKAIEAKDTYTKGHCERVTSYALTIGKVMNLDNEEMSALEFASLLHDIGKIGIPSKILNKTDRLTNEEFNIIKKHPQIGFDILKDVKFLEKSSEILLQHHERPNGTGYPYGLLEKDINKLSKILSVADSFDAMTSIRPYRNTPMTEQEVINQFLKNKNTQFSAEIVDIFVPLIEKGIIN